MTPDIERLRRFGLIIALILISYAAAGVGLESGAKVSVLGLPFIIRRPELLPLGLMLASAYAVVRYYYYGFMLSRSPQRRRKDLLHKLHGHGGRGTYTGSFFLAPKFIQRHQCYQSDILSRHSLRKSSGRSRKFGISE